MDKLPEPEFQSDPNWKRLLLGVDQDLDNSVMIAKRNSALLFAFASYRYLRYVTFYKKNYLEALVVLPLFALSSWFIMEKRYVDPFYTAAKKNNEKEIEYINKYKSLLKEASSKNITVSDDLIL